MTVGFSLFQRPPRDEAGDSEFAATVASLPPSLEDAVASDWRPGDSQPFESQPFDTEPPDSLPPDSLPLPEGGAAKARASVAERAASPGTADGVADQPTTAQVGRYALKSRLGLGGLGQVHEAWDPLLSRTVAIKTLQFESDPRTRASLDRMFLNEARAAAGMSHPNIVTIYDAGLSPEGVYIAMERLHGQDLSQRIAEGWKPGPAQIAQLIRRVADALAYAHARGVVHCDIKPANIFINRRDKPKVLDFGIARVAHGRALPGMEGMVAGSPHYLAPEQLQGGDVDARTDVYALGVVFYEMLSGRRAFTGDSVEQITTAVLTNHPAPAHMIRSGVPEELSNIAARAMARNPAARFASGSELAQEIRAWFDRPAAAKTAAKEPVAAQLPPRADLTEATVAAIAVPTAPRNPWLVRGLALTIAAGAAVTLMTLPREGARSVPAATASALQQPAAAAPAAQGDLVLMAGIPIAASPAASAVAPPPAAPEPAATLTPAPATAPAGAPPVAPPAATGATSSTGEVQLTSPPPPAVAAPPATPPAASQRAAGAEDAGTPRRPSPVKPASPSATDPAAARAARRSAPATTATAATPAAAAASGTVQLAISPWGQVEVDGQAAGTTPPLTQLTLSEGTHTITVRNADFPVFTAVVQVNATRPAVIRHRFGQ